jgi:hypothetical protein
MSKIKIATPEEIDARANQLMDEFFQHMEDVRTASPTQQDIDTVFQGWSIQKVAALQLLVEELTKAVR